MKNKKLSKYNAEEITIYKGWFARLKQLADKFEKNPTETNKQLLLGYISSAEFIIKNI